MRRTVVLTLSVALPGLLAISADAAANQQPGQEPSQEPSMQARPQAGMPGEQTASEKTAAELEQAQVASQEGDARRAAQHLENAATELRREATDAPGEDKRLLERSARQLEQSAEAAKKEEGKLTEASNKEIARVEHDLASHHVNKARESWAEKAAEKTGHELRAAAHHLENATKWGGVKLERGTRDVVGGATRVSGKLIEGAGFVPREVGQAIESVGSEVDKVGRKITPRR